MKRLSNLDYLRGLAAFGIMIYHYMSHTFGAFAAETFMGRVGIYGVSIFYVLSGLTLYYVYYDKMKPDIKDVSVFFKKRFFRIFPLLWLVTLIAILISWRIPDFTILFLNLTGLFGFIKWDAYFTPGVWSIGNELVFYFFFPFFILFVKKFKLLMVLLSFLIFGIYLYFAFAILNRYSTLNEQWSIYTNPLNQVFLFLGGFLIGILFHNARIKNEYVLSLLIFALLIFIFYPVRGNDINLVTGTNRLIFTALSFLICISFYKLNFIFPKFIHKPLSLLGEASYSVYLIHPIIYTLTGIGETYSNKHLVHIHEYVRFLSSVLCTLILSYFVYMYFERYFMNLGRGKK